MDKKTAKVSENDRRSGAISICSGEVYNERISNKTGPLRTALMKENTKDGSMQGRVEASISDEVVVVPDTVRDERGLRTAVSGNDPFKALGLPTESVQDNHSRAAKGGVRGRATSRDGFSVAQVSVLVLTKNGMPDINSCLKAVYGQCGVGLMEVIVVDSGSTDETMEIAKAFPVRLEQIPPASFHHARTRNFAAGLASGEILVFLSQDAIPSSDRWLEAMVANFADPGVGAVYGRQMPKPASTLERKDALDAVYGEQRIVKDPAHRNGLGYRFYHFSDANAAMRRSVWEATCFPEDLKVFEDLGIAKRILDAGWKIVYEPAACVFHSHSHTTSGLFKRYFDIGYTLKLLKIWDAPGTRKSLLRDGWKLLKGKVKRVGNKGSEGLAAKGIRQDIAKSVGLFLGLNQSYLPLVVKKRLSAFRIFE
jgi:rhamnosyltransferase